MQPTCRQGPNAGWHAQLHTPFRKPRIANETGAYWGHKVTRRIIFLLAALAAVAWGVFTLDQRYDLRGTHLAFLDKTQSETADLLRIATLGSATHPLAACVLSEDGETLVTQTQDGTTDLWRLPTLDHLRRIPDTYLRVIAMPGAAGVDLLHPTKGIWRLDPTDGSSLALLDAKAGRNLVHSNAGRFLVYSGWGEDLWGAFLASGTSAITVTAWDAQIWHRSAQSEWLPFGPTWVKQELQIPGSGHGHSWSREPDFFHQTLDGQFTLIQYMGETVTGSPAAHPYVVIRNDSGTIESTGPDRLAGHFVRDGADHVIVSDEAALRIVRLGDDPTAALAGDPVLRFTTGHNRALTFHHAFDDILIATDDDRKIRFLVIDARQDKILFSPDQDSLDSTRIGDQSFAVLDAVTDTLKVWRFDTIASGGTAPDFTIPGVKRFGYLADGRWLFGIGDDGTYWRLDTQTDGPIWTPDFHSKTWAAVWSTADRLVQETTSGACHIYLRKAQ